MRKLFLLLITITTAIGSLLAQETGITAGRQVTLKKDMVAEQPPDCRETNAINKAAVADCYPFLSADGLRLYFTSDREGGFGRFFISTRQAVTEPFGKPAVLDKHLTDEFYAGTFTADELTLCMVRQGSMYISVRSGRNAGFSLPVKLEGTSDDYHFAPAISPDGKQLIVMVTLDGKDIIRVYDRVGLYSVKEMGELPVPVEGIPGPGQFSKDGLSYYFSIEIAGSENIWRYSRTRINDQFADLQELPVHLKALKNNLQPSVNSDGSIMVFVTSPTNLWEANDLVLVNNVKAGLNAPEQFKTVTPNNSVNLQVKSKVELIPLKVYPNPFSNRITVEIKDLPVGGAFLTVYDLSGRKIKQEKITGSKMNIALDQLIPGMYIYHILDGAGKLISSGKLVKGS